MARGYSTSDGQLLPQCDDYRRGKLPFQARRVLKAKRVRNYLIAHPEGTTSQELRTSLGILPPQSNQLQWLQQRGMARWKKSELDGAIRWFASDMKGKVEE